MKEQVSRALALCGIEVPIYQEGLGGVAGPDLAAAVSQAGGARKVDDEKYARNFSVYGGQGVERIKEILSAGEIVARLQASSPRAG